MEEFSPKLLKSKLTQSLKKLLQILEGNDLLLGGELNDRCWRTTRIFQITTAKIVQGREESETQQFTVRVE